MSDDGRNPLRWDCEDGRRCFNRLCRPKIEVFAECFAGKNAFGDVDGIIERNGKFLMIEWKSRAGQIPVGQRITHERLTLVAPVVVVIVAGNAETMAVEKIAICKNGVVSPWEVCSLEDLKERMRKWDRWASSCKAFSASRSQRSRRSSDSLTPS